PLGSMRMWKGGTGCATKTLNESENAGSTAHSRTAGRVRSFMALILLWGVDDQEYERMLHPVSSGRKTGTSGQPTFRTMASRFGLGISIPSRMPSVHARLLWSKLL